MSKQVIGVYDSEEAVVTAVQQLQNKGYDTDDISVVTNHERSHDNIEMRTGAEVDNLAELNKQEETLFDKIKTHLQMMNLDETTPTSENAWRISAFQVLQHPLMQQMWKPEKFCWS